MSCFPYFVCALLGVDSLRGGLAEGNRISETDFFHILTIHNDQISYANHVLDPLYVTRPLGARPCLGGDMRGQARKRSSLNRLVPPGRRSP